MTTRARAAVIAVQVLAVCAASWTLSPFIHARTADAAIETRALACRPP